MNVQRVFEDRLISTVKTLPTNKLIELIAYAEYLKKRGNWEKRFQVFLSKIEDKFENITEEDIDGEIREVRAAYGRKSKKT